MVIFPIFGCCRKALAGELFLKYSADKGKPTKSRLMVRIKNSVNLFQLVLLGGINPLPPISFVNDVRITACLPEVAPPHVNV